MGRVQRKTVHSLQVSLRRERKASNEILSIKYSAFCNKQNVDLYVFFRDKSTSLFLSPSLSLTHAMNINSATIID